MKEMVSSGCAPMIFLAMIKFLAGISEILNKNSRKPLSFLAVYANLGERKIITNLSG